MIFHNRALDATTGITQVEIIDTTAQTVTYEPPRPGPPDPETGEPGEPITTRPFTADEITYWTGYEAGVISQQVEAELRQNPQQRIDGMLASIAALKAVIGQGTDPAGTTTLQALRNQTNATINGSPAATIKALTGFVIDVAREDRRIARDAVALARLALGVTDSADTGEA